mgnify:CR=1 FL=1
MRIIKTVAAFILAAHSASASPEFCVHEWPDTNFENTSVANWVEILSGGPPKDGIPAIDDPQFISVSDAELATNEPVITVEIEGERKIMAVGDTIHFDSTRIHSTWNHGTETASILWCGTMDAFGEAPAPIHKISSLGGEAKTKPKGRKQNES